MFFLNYCFFFTFFIFFLIYKNIFLPSQLSLSLSLSLSLFLSPSLSLYFSLSPIFLIGVLCFLSITFSCFSLVCLSQPTRAHIHFSIFRSFFRLFPVCSFDSVPELSLSPSLSLHFLSQNIPYSTPFPLTQTFSLHLLLCGCLSASVSLTHSLFSFFLLSFSLAVCVS